MGAEGFTALSWCRALFLPQASRPLPASPVAPLASSRQDPSSSQDPLSSSRWIPAPHCPPGRIRLSSGTTELIFAWCQPRCWDQSPPGALGKATARGAGTLHFLVPTTTGYPSEKKKPFLLIFCQHSAESGTPSLGAIFCSWLALRSRSSVPGNRQSRAQSCGCITAVKVGRAGEGVQNPPLHPSFTL